MSWYGSILNSPLVNPYQMGKTGYQEVRGGSGGGSVNSDAMRRDSARLAAGGGTGSPPPGTPGVPPATGAPGTRGAPIGPGPAPAMGGGHDYNGPAATPTGTGADWYGIPNNPNGRRAQSGATPPATGGTQSGPGILEQWFNQRANGTDPAFEYASKRGMEALGNQSAAAGNFNSGAARQGEGDFMSNLVSQREGQLDALAGGASGEHQGRVNSMFSQGMGLAGGQANTMGAYDLASAHSNDALMDAIIQLMGGKAGVDDKSRQQGLTNALGIAALA